MNSKTTEEKKMLRKVMRSRLKNYFSANDGKIDSELAAGKILELDEFKSSEIVLAFLSAKNEIDCQLIIDIALVTGKIVAVPKVKSESDMDFFILNPQMPLESQVAQGSFGIREPKDELLPLNTENLSEKDVFVIVPGLSFTKNGFRLGKGKGFYDRYIQRLKSSGAKLFLSGICFPFQIEDSIPTDDFDEKMDFVAY
ncbi:MAG: 5-formyltetrahydrofolate cyclo-ligase [Treponema sp.]|nr:5-formyltetrahydrofolate cyclo-ligase [Treponema sp.]